MRRLQVRWRDACTDAGVSYVSLYPALKHSPGTAMLEAGVPLEHVQALYAHRSERTVRIYDLGGNQRRDAGLDALRALMEPDADPSETERGPKRDPINSLAKSGESGGRARIRTADPLGVNEVL